GVAADRVASLAAFDEGLSVDSAGGVRAAMAPRGDSDDPRGQAELALDLRALAFKKSDEPLSDAAESNEDEIERHADGATARLVVASAFTRTSAAPISINSSRARLSPSRRWFGSSPNPRRR